MPTPESQENSGRHYRQKCFPRLEEDPKYRTVLQYTMEYLGSRDTVLCMQLLSLGAQFIVHNSQKADPPQRHFCGRLLSSSLRGSRLTLSHAELIWLLLIQSTKVSRSSAPNAVLMSSI